jgi:hypothetical protein
MIDVKLIFVLVVSAVFCWAAALAAGQTPTITSIQVVSTGCEFTAGLPPNAPNTPCSIGPGMVLQVIGQNFGQRAFGVGLCDCPDATIIRWTPTEISVTVDEVTPQSVIQVEAYGGDYSNTVPYVALAPVITRIEVGTCSFTPNVSRKQCAITPGTTVTIHGNYFGRYAGQVATCDCAGATIDTWNPNWTSNPRQFDNTIVITALQAICGSAVLVEAGYMWSNPVPYTTCAQ